MKMIFRSLVLFLSIQSAQQALAITAPNAAVTPGALCTAADADFKGFDYPEHVARCNRNIALPEKQKVAEEYGGIPEANWSEFEFDHFLPLCAGGANDIRNLWPQPIAEAHQKDVLENQVCLAMKAGTMTQAQAVDKVYKFFQTGILEMEVQHPLTLPTAAQVICRSSDSTVIRFSQPNANTILNPIVTLATENGEHEANRTEGAVTGQPVSSNSALLKDYFRFSLNKSSDDKFEVFLPAQAWSQPVFRAYFKLSFEGNYPTLSEITCQRSAPGAIE